MIIEISGYIGSVLVIVSMLMSSVVKLRIINTVDSFCQRHQLSAWAKQI